MTFRLQTIRKSLNWRLIDSRRALPCVLHIKQCSSILKYGERTNEQAHQFRKSSPWKEFFLGVGVVYAACQSEDVKDEAAEIVDPDFKEEVAKVGYAELKKRVKEAMVHTRLGEFDKADKIYHEVLKLIQKFQDNDTLDGGRLLRATVFVYSMMGNLALQKGDLQRAEKLFVECIKGLVQDGKPMDDDAIVELSLKIATIRGRMGKLEDAEIGFKFCIEKESTKLENMRKQGDEIPKEDLANTLGWLGMCLHAYCKFLLDTKRSKEAEEQMALCLKYGEIALPEGHPQLAVLNNDMSQIMANQNKHKESIPFLEKAIQCAHKESFELVLILGNLAVTHAHLGDFKTADEQFKKMKNLARKFKGAEAQSAVEECRKRIKLLKSK